MNEQVMTENKSPRFRRKYLRISLGKKLAGNAGQHWLLL
jgi:hypothetical protein